MGEQTVVEGSLASSNVGVEKGKRTRERNNAPQPTRRRMRLVYTFQPGHSREFVRVTHHCVRSKLSDETLVFDKLLNLLVSVEESRPDVVEGAASPWGRRPKSDQDHCVTGL